MARPSPGQSIVLCGLAAIQYRAEPTVSVAVEGRGARPEIDRSLADRIFFICDQTIPLSSYFCATQASVNTGELSRRK